MAPALSRAERPTPGSGGKTGPATCGDHGPLMTDAAGHFELVGLPAQMKVWLQRGKTDMFNSARHRR